MRGKLTDSPDGFVGNDNILPVLLGEDVGVRLNLREDEVVGSTRLARLEGLPAASDDLNPPPERVLGLGGHLGGLGGLLRPYWKFGDADHFVSTRDRG